MENRIKAYIHEHQDEMFADLAQLIRSPSPDGGDTLAQETVKRKLEELGFVTESFQMDERVTECADYCELDILYTEGAYNLAGRKDGGFKKTLILFGHIDTERANYFGSFADPYQCQIKDNKICGLGASDDKGGIAMILSALKTMQALDLKPEYNITVLSLLGKHGGAFGTLSAMLKGYGQGDAIYVHPAETGHGFREIKNISLGVLDLKLTVYGEKGKAHDDLSVGTNANLLLAEAITILEEFNQRKRKERLFDFSSFKGQPSYLLNIGTVSSQGSYGSICEKAECLMRCRFFFPQTTASVYDEIYELLKEKLEGKWELEKGSFRAEPAMTANDDPFVRMIEKSVESVEGKTEFIHQYHGGSDIRFPILYGGGRCVGIGPYCELPAKGSGNREWLDQNDYLKGIEILTQIMLRYGNVDI